MQCHMGAVFPPLVNFFKKTTIPFLFGWLGGGLYLQYINIMKLLYYREFLQEKYSRKKEHCCRSSLKAKQVTTQHCDNHAYSLPPKVVEKHDTKT